MWWINVHGNVYLSSSFNYKPRYGLPNWPHKRESCWLEKGRCERKESNVVLVQQECLKGTYGSSLADWVIASIDDTTGSCASLSFCTSKTNTRWWPKHVTTEDGVYSSWLGGVNKNSKKKKLSQINKNECGCNVDRNQQVLPTRKQWGAYLQCNNIKEPGWC
jgi:hypothetical protein